MPARCDSSIRPGRSARVGCGASGASSIALVGAQQADELAQLLQSLPSRRLHLVGELAHLGGVLGGHLGRAGLQHHQADPVAHHVVHLPGDPDPLLEDRATGLQLLGALRALGPLRRGPDQLGARRDIGAEGRRPQHEATGDDHRTVQGPVVADHREDDTRCNHQRRDPDRPARMVGRHGVGSDGQLPQTADPAPRRRPPPGPGPAAAAGVGAASTATITGIRSASIGSDQPMSTECSSIAISRSHGGGGEDEVGRQHLSTGPRSSWAHPCETRPMR